MTIEMEESTREVISNEESLLSLISKKMAVDASKEIVFICAGHFTLFPDKERKTLIPGIMPEKKDNNYGIIQSLIGIFPQYSWSLGCAIFNKVTESKRAAKLSLLINDWQMVPKDVNRDPSQPNGFRDQFYKSFKKLPDEYSKVMLQHKLKPEKDLYQTKDGEFFLREVRLQDRFLRKLKSYLSKNPQSPIGNGILSQNERGEVILNKNGISTLLSTANGAGCAGGITQMLLELGRQYSSEYQRIHFINLMPRACTIPVNVASDLALDILNEEEIKTSINVVNIYFDPKGINEDDRNGASYFPQVNCFEFKSDRNE